MTQKQVPKYRDADEKSAEVELILTEKEKRDESEEKALNAIKAFESIKDVLDAYNRANK